MKDPFIDSRAMGPPKPLAVGQGIGPSEVKPRRLGSLAAVVPDIIDAEHARRGPRETRGFPARVSGSPEPLECSLQNSSDDPFRAFRAFVAIAPLANGAAPVKLVGIEEPLTALHPAASGALMDAPREAAAHTQVEVTTHRADLLDEIDPAADRPLVVRFRDGETKIGPIDPADREVVEESFYQFSGRMAPDGPGWA